MPCKVIFTMAMKTKNGERIFSDVLLFHISQFQNEQAQAILANANPHELVDSSHQTLLHYTVFYKNAKIAKYLIDIGCEVDAKNTFGVTALMLAVDLKHKPTIEVLLKAKADIFVRNYNGGSPLQAALAYRSEFHTDIAVMFLDVLKKQVSNAPESLGKILLEYECPLPRAMLLKDTAVTRFMLANGCTIHDVDSISATSLHYAVSCMDLDNVKLLVELGADVNMENNKQQTPLHFYDFGQEENHEILRLLLDRGASLTAREANGYMVATPMFRYGGVGIVKILLEYEVDLYARNSDESTLLHHIASNKNPGVIELLQGRQFDVNATDIDGRTALWNAAETVNQDALKFLLKNGANTNLLDVDEYTALFYGFYSWVEMKDDTKNCLRCLELLLEYGADVQLVGCDQETIFDIALESNDVELIKPVIAHLAMLEAIGEHINEFILAIINSYDMFAKYFDICRRKLKKLQNTVIYENVTLFKFLVEPEEKLVMYARNQETVSRVEQIIYRERHSNLYFIKTLRKRVRDVVKIAKLREEASMNLSNISGLKNNRNIIDKIVLFFDKNDLKNICES